jgi:hypothetical protein
MVSLGFSTQRRTHSTSLTWAASRNFRPPYLTNGTPRRAKQHRLPLQVDARFAVLQDALDHIISLRQLIGRDDKGRPLAGRLVGEEVLPGSPRSPARSPRCRSSRIGSRKE